MTLPFNTKPDGTSHTIKTNYSNMGSCNILDISSQGENFKATGAIVIYE